MRGLRPGSRSGSRRTEPDSRVHGHGSLPGRQDQDRVQVHLFDDAAVAAVKQWRYKPLLLNGVPTEFILTATVKLNLLTDPVPRKP